MGTKGTIGKQTFRHSAVSLHTADVWFSVVHTFPGRDLRFFVPGSVQLKILHKML